jgi:preprotein translocase subunit SecE
VAEFVQELFQAGLYKRSQGRIARQVTAVAMALVVALGAWRLYDMWTDKGDLMHFGIPTILLFAGLWISYRLVNMPTFANFLISVEAEMNKVSWPSRGELARSVLVVIFTIFFLAAVLFGFDILWKTLLGALGVL